jgi:hypothetical protein
MQNAVQTASSHHPRISQDMVFFGSFDSNLYALNSSTGWVNWKLWLNKPILSSPFIRDNLLYIGSSDGMIYCIDIMSNKEVWHFATQNQVTSSPLVSKDALYCGSVDGFLYSRKIILVACAGSLRRMGQLLEPRQHRMKGYSSDQRIIAFMPSRHRSFTRSSVNRMSTPVKTSQRTFHARKGGRCGTHINFTRGKFRTNSW